MIFIAAMSLPKAMKVAWMATIRLRFTSVISQLSLPIAVTFVRRWIPEMVMIEAMSFALHAAEIRRATPGRAVSGIAGIERGEEAFIARKQHDEQEISAKRGVDERKCEGNGLAGTMRCHLRRVVGDFAQKDDGLLGRTTTNARREKPVALVCRERLGTY